MDDLEQQTVSKLVQRAVALVDPEGGDDAAAQLQMAFEDDDRPALGLGDTLAEELRTTVEGLDPEHDSAAAEVAAAVASHLATNPAGGGDGEVTIRVASRVAWGDDPPENVSGWLAARGVDV